jgi:two-component system cell cycle response regulator DivK
MPVDLRTLGERPITVLLVDDDADSREMYAAALRFAGIAAHMAADGEAGFQLALSLQPDVIVTDFVLRGGENGAAFCRKLHGDPRTAGIKVLVVTGSTRKGDAEALLGAGCSEIRTKPYLPEALIGEIRRLTRAA